MDRIDVLQMMTTDPETGLPALTTLLYKVCEQDGEKFDEACRLIRLFMTIAQKDVK
jgi:hypothetical protein